MFLIPPLARLARGAGRQMATTIQTRAEPEMPPAAAEGRVIVAGYGRVGRLVGEMLDRHGIPYLAVDADPARVKEQRALGRPVYFGDSTNPELLRRCGSDSARALVVTLDSARTIEAVVAAARAERPDLTIIARARDARHATALYALGVDDAVPETIEASLQLSEAVLVDIGVPLGLVIASIHERRDEYRKVLRPKREDATPAPSDVEGERSAGQFLSRRQVGKVGS
jgi:CPA2 family monovalent cation:H+ antiporter-2